MAFGDANISPAIFVLGRFLFGNWDWPQKFTLVKAHYAGLLGAGVAIGIEPYALVHDRWAYTTLIPVITRIDGQCCSCSSTDDSAIPRLCYIP